MNLKRTMLAALVAAVLIPGKGGWSRTDSGEQPPMLFWASAGKTLVAVVVLQLVEAGKLKLLAATTASPLTRLSQRWHSQCRTKHNQHGKAFQCHCGFHIRSPC